MPNPFTNTTFSTTYKDDFKDSDHYHRILFNSGRALQARELTQLQTITQKELERLGRHVFKEGSVVLPGGLTVDFNYAFVKLETSDTSGFAVGNTLTGQTSGVQAKLLEIVAATDTDPATFYIKYINSGTSTGTIADSPTFSVAEFLSNGSTQIQTQIASSAADPTVGIGAKASVGSGVYFVRGHFVSVNPQSTIVSKYSSTAEETIGFKYVEDIVTVSDTNALYDNQNNNIPNLTAPGADRYRITLTLTTQSSIDSDENFFTINAINNGEIQREIDDTDYNRIGNELAVRTKEESGDYVVEGLTSVVKAGDSDKALTLNVQPGVAYADGFRLALTGSTELTIPKPRTTEVIEQTVAANYGNYILVSADAGQGFIPNINTFEVLNLRSAADYGGSTIGTARVRSITEDGSNYRLYIFDVKMNSGQKFSSVRSIGLGANEYFDLVIGDTNNIAIIREGLNNNLFFSLGRQKPSLVNDITLTVQRRFTGTTNADGELPLTGLGTDESFTNQTQWIVAIDSAEDQILPNATAAGAVVTTGRNAEEIIEVIAYVTKTASAASVRGKTRTTVTETGLTVESDGAGFKFVKLANPDIFTLTSVVDSETNNSLLNRFTLDNGQRDNFYYNGRLILNNRLSAPDGTIKVTYDHFNHGTGDFFAVNSYDAADIGYQNIPSHRQADGTYIDLRDVLDFRPYKESDGASYTAANINELPQNTDDISADITYYRGRNDILTISATEDLKRPQLNYIKGVEALDNRITPIVPEGHLKLKDFELEPFTDNEADLSESIINNRRFTMRDISDIVDRIDNIEEAVTLNLLEAQTAAIEVLDSSGANRFKNGFFADDFKGLDFSDVAQEQYTATLDQLNNVLLPDVVENNVPLVYDSSSSASVNTKLSNGNFLTLDYTDQLHFNQDVASETENINPFEVISFVGNLELSPDVDTWQEVRRINRVVRRVRNVVAPRRSGRRGQRETFTVNIPGGFSRNRAGGAPGVGRIPLPDREVVFTRFTARRTRPEPRRVTQATDRTVNTSFGQITLLPNIRARLVNFRARALRPNTRHFLFFDGQLLNDPNGQNYAREETTFPTFSRRTSDRHINSRATTHPDGTTDLYSDANGEILGSFLIPNNRSFSFTAGEREVKLMDVSVNDEAKSGSLAAAIYQAQGSRRTVIRTVQQRRRDPLAQSFTIQNNDGIFLTKIDIYFSTKPTSGADANIPVRLELRPLRNGVPSQDEVIPGSQVVLNPSDVNIPSDLTDLAEVRLAPTSFQFDSPVYLQGNVPYALILMADTVEYNVYVAEAGGFVLGTTDQRILRQPTLGSLFLSQNAQTWTPDQTRDMMYRLHRAKFSTSGTALIENIDLPNAVLGNDPISTDSGSTTVTIDFRGHGFGVNDKVQLFGLDSNTTYGGIKGSSLLGERTVTAIDGNSFTFTADSAATSTVVSGDSGVSMTQCIQMDQALPSIDAFIPAASARLDFEASFASGRSIVPAVGDGTNSQNNFALGDAISFSPDDAIIFESPQVVANRATETAASTLLGSTSNPRRSVKIDATLSTSNDFVSPVIIMNDAQLITSNNIIDNPDSDASITNPFNNPLTFVAETDPRDGTALSKHLTIPIVLDEPAVGIKAILGVNRPSGANIDVFFRTLAPGSDLNINEVAFTLATQDTILQTDEDPSVYRNYEYTIGGLNGTLEPFTTFQLKVVMRSSNSSKVPAIRDLRAIALGT